jgi:AraC-like DNA-binding protein
MMPTPPLRWPLDALPRIRLAGRFPLDDRAFPTLYLSPTHALHLHDYQGTLRLGRDELALVPGCLTLTPAHRPSWYDLPAAGYHWCIHFDPVPTRRPCCRMPLLLHAHDRQHIIADQFAQIVQLHTEADRSHADSAVARAAASAALQQLLLSLQLWQRPHAHAATPHRSRAALDHAVQLLHHQLDQPLHIPQLAKKVGLSQNYLAHRFRLRFGVTIPRYLMQRRIEQARLLLLTTDLLIKQVADRVGMPDPQHFNKQFRRLTGESPSVYRAKAAASLARS